MTATNRSLVISSKHDATASYLCEIMNARGLDHVRLDTETFPTRWLLQWEVEPAGSPRLVGDEGEVDMREVSCVWYRRPEACQVDASISHPAVRRFTVRECERALSAVWHASDAHWVNEPAAIEGASAKPHQLRTAAALGLRVPDTILTNDDDVARAFWVRHEGNVVCKPLHQEAVEVEGANYFAYTAHLSTERYADLERVRLCPVLIQGYIKPKRELRVTVVGDQLFAAALDAEALPEEPDWRRLMPEQQPWNPCTLDKGLRARCVQLVREYGLTFGAIDLIQEGSGEYVFLELNPNGQWVWIELITGLPISTAFIDLFERRQRPSVSL